MADIGQVLATGGTTIVAVAVGAGLTYWFGALNRRQQEAREDRTRWYDMRFQAYAEFSTTAFSESRNVVQGEDNSNEVAKLIRAVGVVRLVASPEVMDAADSVLEAVEYGHRNLKRLKEATFEDRFGSALERFEDAARRDLGHPV
jgi:hypothetical protein